MNTPYSDGVFYANNIRVNPFLMDSVEELTPGIAIDYGCGIGTNASFLKQKGWDVYVVEREQIAIDSVIKKIEEKNVIQSDILNLDFSILPQCNLFICNYVLQHISKRDAQQFLASACQNLLIGGHAVLSLFERDEAIDEATLENVMISNSCFLQKSKKWSRWDYDHGPAHFHKGFESLWCKQSDPLVITPC